MDDFDRLMEVQRRTASLIRQESEVDNKIKILDILVDLTRGKRKKIQVEEVIVEAGFQGLGEAEVINTLDELKKDGMVVEPEVGFIQMI